jgi:hypothetical protein
MILHVLNYPEEEIVMSLTFEKSLTSHTSAEARLVPSDGNILLIATLALLAMIYGFVSLLPAAPGGDIASPLALFVP